MNKYYFILSVVQFLILFGVMMIVYVFIGLINALFEYNMSLAIITFLVCFIILRSEFLTKKIRGLLGEKLA